MTNNWSRWGSRKPDPQSTGTGDGDGASGSSIASSSPLNENVEGKASPSVVKEDVEAQHSDQAATVDRKLSSEMRKIVRGVISVTVERAENLVSKDGTLCSDPFVVLRTRKGGHRKQSKVVYKCLNPKWNETFYFLVEDGKNEKLEIKVWDHDTFGRDFLGSCATALTKAINNGEDKAEFKLDGVASGVIFLTLKWIPVPFEQVDQKRFSLTIDEPS